MAQITVSINGFNYTVGCEDGQEAHLQAMAQIVENHIDIVRQIGGQSGEGRLLALASLIMADKLYDMDNHIRILEKNQDKDKVEALTKENERLKNQLEHFSERAEALAEKLKIA